MKKVFPFKNFYAGFILPLTFLVGAAANSQISEQTFVYYLLISIYIFTISLISDLRDVRGDEASGIRTIPVAWGKNVGGKAVYFSLSLFFLSVLSTKAIGLYPLLPFLVPVAFFIKMGNPKKSHVSSMTSFMFLPFGIFILKFFGGF
jgi:4-hydroxybenzoate polyprenyltransferase